MVTIKIPGYKKIKKSIRRFFTGMHERMVYGFKKLMRRCYYFGFKKCLVIAGAMLMAVIVLCIACCGNESTETPLAPEPAVTASPEIPYTETIEPVVKQTDEPEVMPVPEETPEPESTPEPTPRISYKKGDEGEDIQKLQTRLMDLGYLDIDEPGTRYGSATRDAVKLFQRQHGLDQDGIVGNDTYDLLMSRQAKEYVMYEGAEGSDIKAFQMQLYELGYLKKSQITGYYGTDTVNAVKSFQKRNKLSQDGKAGERTIDTINSSKARVSASKESAIKAEKAKAAEEAKKKSAEARVDAFIAVAKTKIGCKYKLGESGPDVFDCSGFVYYCLRKSHVYCLRLNAKGFSQNSDWMKVPGYDSIKRGDLLFYKIDGRSGVGHVAIYLGNGEMIDASTAEGKIVIRSCNTSFWKRNFVCARRPIK